MKKFGFMSVFLLMVLLSGCGAGGDEESSADSWIRGGTVTDSAGKPIAGAQINVPLDKMYSATTNENGQYVLSIPESVSLPGFFAGTIHKQGYITRMTQFSYSGGQLNQSDSSPQLTKSTDADIYFPIGLTVVHLGDDNYGGSANSQLQVRTLGLAVSESATLTKEQLSKYKYLRISLYARGVETERCNKITFGNKSSQSQVQDFVATANDGSYTPVSYRFTLSSVSPGEIAFTIFSGAKNCSNSGDHDDFEVTAITGKLEAL